MHTRVPFCPLPDDVKAGIAAGYYEGRSPDVVGVRAVPVAGGGGEPTSPWPAADPLPDTRVPLAFLGTGVNPHATIPEQLSLDRAAPTLTEILDTRWSFPDVSPTRSSRPRSCSSGRWRSSHSWSSDPWST